MYTERALFTYTVTRLNPHNAYQLQAIKCVIEIGVSYIDIRYGIGLIPWHSLKHLGMRLTIECAYKDTNLA